MKKSNCFAILLLFTIFFSVMPAFLSADTFIKQTSYMSAMEVMGNKVPAQIDSSDIWISDTHILMNTGDTTSILGDIENKKVYYINHSKKMYVEFNLDDIGNFEKMLGLDKSNPEEAAQLQMIEQMRAMQKMTVTITPTDETSEILGFKCKKYIQSMKIGMASIDMDIWATTEISINRDMYQQVENFFTSLSGGYEEAAKEFEKVDGFMIKGTGTLNVMGATAELKNEVIEHKEIDAPDGTYSIPKGYTKSEGLGVPNMGM